MRLQYVLKVLYHLKNNPRELYLSYKRKTANITLAIIYHIFILLLLT